MDSSPVALRAPIVRLRADDGANDAIPLQNRCAMRRGIEWLGELNLTGGDSEVSLELAVWLPNSRP
jgi:hypothetical protein